jgi:hypothetical protein
MEHNILGHEKVLNERICGVQCCDQLGMTQDFVGMHYKSAEFFMIRLRGSLPDSGRHIWQQIFFSAMKTQMMALRSSPERKANLHNL